MIQPTVEHFIQRDILRSLSRSSMLSFANLKPDGLDNGIFSYHLKRLLAVGLVDKDNGYYILSTEGMRYVGRATRTNLDVLPQPKLFSLLIIRNDHNQYILHRRNAQPLIGRYTFPGGALFFDEDIDDHIGRQLQEKIGIDVPLTDRGMASLRLGDKGQVLSHTYARLFYSEVVGSPSLSAKDSRFTPEWIDPSLTSSDEILPDIAIIIEKIQASPEYFFLDLKLTV